MAELTRKHIKMPVYVAVDVSQSMGMAAPGRVSAWQAANQGLQTIAQSTLVLNPELRDLCLLGVVAFNEAAQVHRSAIDEGPLSLPPLPQPVGQTNFRRLFETLKATIEADLRQIAKRNWDVKRPAVFLITDGKPYMANGPQPASHYMPAVRSLLDLQVQTNRGPRSVAVVPFGFGDADAQVLCRVRSADMHAYLGPAQSSGEVVTAIMQSILNSIVASATGPQIRIRAPRGVQTVAC